MKITDENLNKYIKKMLEVQQVDFNQQSFTKEELKEIALDTGISEEAWEELQEQAEMHFQRAVQHAKQESYEDAVKEMNEAIGLNPARADFYQELANAYYLKGAKEQDSITLQLALKNIDQSLAIEPASKKAIALKSKIQNFRRASVVKAQGKKRSRYIYVAAIAGMLIVILLLLKNNLISKEENVYKSWAQVENVYQRRAELVPQLVRVVKAAADHEEKVFTTVTKARNQASELHIDLKNSDAGTLEKFFEKQGSLSQELGKLMAVAESYPQLKSMENFLALQSQLEGSDNRIAVERKRFNESVMNYNSSCRKFPYNLLGCNTKDYYLGNPDNQKVPDINL